MDNERISKGQQFTKKSKKFLKNDKKTEKRSIKHINLDNNWRKERFR